jgi:SsrA-binding protein
MAQIKPEKKSTPRVIENRRARREYDITETFEAGIVLTGSEVKSLRLGKADPADAYVLPNSAGDMTVINLRIEPYQNASFFNHDEKRTRQLLLKKKEIVKLTSQIKEKRLTLVILKMYFNERGKVKLLLGLGTGRKMADKREHEKAAVAKKEMERALKESRR